MTKRIALFLIALALALTATGCGEAKYPQASPTEIAAAKQAYLKQLAHNANAASGVAYVEMDDYAHWLDGRSGYFYTSRSDMVTVIDYFCKEHDVHPIDTPKISTAGEYNVFVGFTFRYEPNK